MLKNNFPILIAAVIFLLFSANSAFAQCGADGTQPCNPAPKKRAARKTPASRPRPVSPKINSQQNKSQPQTSENNVKQSSEFDTATYCELATQMDYFLIKLNNNPDSHGVIINYGTDEQVAERMKLLITILLNKDSSHIKFVRGRSGNKIITKFFVVMSGDKEPAP